MERVFKLMCAMAVGAFCLFAQTNNSEAQTAVDLELFLSVDASFSINSTEFAFQQSGYSAAFRDAAIFQAIENLPNGIAVSMAYWSENNSVAVDWFHITDEASSIAFANMIDAAARPMDIGTLTGLGNAIAYAHASVDGNNFAGTRRVIDVSGDGSQNYRLAPDLFSVDPNNTDPMNTNQRNARLNALFGTHPNLAMDQEMIDVINGIAILNDLNEPVNQPGEDGLLAYYEQFVIGGTGSFAFGANGFGPDACNPNPIPGMTEFGCFSNAIRAKLLLEIIGEPPTGVIPEPATMLLFGSGMLAAYVKKRKR